MPGELIIAAVMLGSAAIARLSGPLSRAFWIWLTIITVIEVGSMALVRLRPDLVCETCTIYDIPPSEPPTYIQHI